MFNKEFFAYFQNADTYPRFLINNTISESFQNHNFSLLSCELSVLFVTKRIKKNLYRISVFLLLWCYFFLRTVNNPT
jgi:hypothetical protein